MKRYLVLISLLLLFLSAADAALGQQSCEFNIIGAWQTSGPHGKNPTVYRFGTDGKVTVSAAGSSQTADGRLIGSGTYKLDNADAPASIVLRGGMFGRSPVSMKIINYNDVSFTSKKPGGAEGRWSRIDSNRYFIVLAARNGEFYDGAGSAFPMLLKISGPQTEVAAVGTYSLKGQRAFGPVPRESYKEYLREPRGDSETVLRLEVNAAQYGRGLKILQTWERRVRDDELLYPTGSPLNNVLLVKAVTETLNQCGETVKLHKLNYLHPDDWIAEQNAPAFIPFAYFRELRRLNESAHLKDSEFEQLLPSSVGLGVISKDTLH